MKVIPNPDPRSSGWRKLVQQSHQTSPFVAPEWIEWLGENAQYLLAVEGRHGFEAGLVLQPPATALPLTLYQGLLMTRREQPTVIRALLEAAESFRPGWQAVNAPSLVDVRPFFWRFHEAQQLWVPDIRYTFFVDERTRPFQDAAPAPRSLAAPAATADLDAFPQLTGIDTAPPGVYTVEGSNPDCRILWTKDAQGRGYFIAGEGPCEGLVLALAQKCPQGVDLYGANSRAMNRRKRLYGARLRTFYRMTHSG